eukprot:1031043-Pelagomonas_calceolata.AAC.1
MGAGSFLKGKPGGVMEGQQSTALTEGLLLSVTRNLHPLLEVHIHLSILWLLNTVPHCYPGKHGAVHECGM